MPVLNISFNRKTWVQLITLGEIDERPENTIRRLIHETAKGYKEVEKDEIINDVKGGDGG